MIDDCYSSAQTSLLFSPTSLPKKNGVVLRLSYRDILALLLFFFSARIIEVRKRKRSVVLAHYLPFHLPLYEQQQQHRSSLRVTTLPHLAAVQQQEVIDDCYSSALLSCCHSSPSIRVASTTAGPMPAALPSTLDARTLENEIQSRRLRWNEDRSLATPISALLFLLSQY